MIAIVVGCCGRSYPYIWKLASFGLVYTRTSGGVLKQQLNDLQHGGRDIPDKGKKVENIMSWEAFLQRLYYYR